MAGQIDVIDGNVMFYDATPDGNFATQIGVIEPPISRFKPNLDYLRLKERFKDIDLMEQIKEFCK